MNAYQCEMLAIALYESQARSNAYMGGHRRAWLNEDEPTREHWRQKALVLYYTEIAE
jgi:hypothetical protein